MLFLAVVRADNMGAAPRSPGSHALSGLLHIEVLMLLSPQADVGGSRKRFAMRRMSMASVPPRWREGLADLTRPAREDERQGPVGDVLLELARAGIAAVATGWEHTLE